MHILTRSILSLITLAVATQLRAEVFPIAEDTVGSVTKGTILKTSGTATAVTIKANTKAYIAFDVGNSGIAPASVKQARLTLYLARVAKTGNLYLANATGDFSETFTASSIPMPSDEILLSTQIGSAQNREFITFDVTNQVKAWLADPASERGFVLAADGALAVTIATKEGAGSGHPAILEVDTTSADASGNFIFNNGNVGIGTAAPADRLQLVGGNLRVGSTNGAVNDSSLLLTPNAIQLPYQGTGNSLNSRDLTISTGRGNIVLNPGTNGSVGGNIRLNGHVNTTGRLGVGTSEPGAMLDVLGLGIMQGLELRGADVSYLDFSGTTAVDFNSRIIYGGAADNRLIFQGAPVTFDTKVTINTSSSGGALEVRDANSALQVIPGTLFGVANSDAVTLDIPGLGTVAVWDNFQISSNAFKPGGGSWAASSDIRLKKNIHDLTGSLDRLLALRSVTFEYAEPDKIHEPAGVRAGFIAQEVETVFPDWVGTKPDGYKYVAPTGFESQAVQALRELRAEKDAEIAALKTQLEAQEARLRALEQRSAKDVAGD